MRKGKYMNVNKHPLAEVIAKKLSGINGVPNSERDEMIIRACNAAVEWYEASRGSRTLSAVPSGAVLESPYGFMTIGTVKVENGHPIINENQLHGISLTHEVPSHWIKVLH